MNAEHTIEDPGHVSPEKAAHEDGDPAKRRQIVDGARKIFLDRGFEGASMGEIARCAGVSKGTLYVYFQNKEELFCAIMQEERQSHQKPTFTIDTSLPVAEALNDFGRRLLTFLLQPKTIAAMRTAMGIAERMPDVGRTFYQRGPGQTIRVVQDYLAEKVAAGMLDIPDTAMAATQYLDLVQSSLIRPSLFGCEIVEAERAGRIAKVVDAGVAVFMRAYGAGPRT
jgi:AcrR family transcriptional regulator